MKVKIKILLVLIVGFCLVLGAHAEEGNWTTRIPIPTATSLHSASVIDGKIYVIGGTDTIYRVATDYFSTAWMYDPATDTWTQKANMSRGRGRFDSSVVDGKIYAIGGSPRGDSDIAIVEMYDPATDTWTRKADMPRARCFLSTSAVDGKIYVIGGKTYPSENMVATVEEYDPVADTWTRKADMLEARGQHSASVVDGKIYVIGGVTGTFGPVVSTVDVYDTETDTWTRKASMPTARFFLSTSVVNGKIYAIGGGNAWGPSLSMVEVYDPTTDTWTSKENIPTARATHSASVVDDEIYVIGGTLGIEPWVPTATVEVYNTGLIVSEPDFNGDGIVDISDLLQLIESWGQDNPLCDITPQPFGDGIVDVLDLEFFMDHWGKPADDPSLIAHWALDELEGDTAYDSAGINDALVAGNPVWLPSDGQVQGAIQLDGIDDCLIATTVLNPANGPFSVFTWIKGNIPGQVVISGPKSTNWLCTDALTGYLITELKGAGRSGKPLQSQTNIIDGNWHQIGLVWDGSYRTLYVDDLLVAEDTQNGLESSNDGLYIGCGKNMEAGTYWSGLIDDVRIYDRVVMP